MSNQYTAIAGDTLRKIASKTLGSPFRWSEILDANPWLNDPKRRAAQQDIGLPDREALFSPGAVFNIPGRDSLIDSGFASGDPNAYKIVLRGPGVSYEITSALEVSEIRFMNTMANGFSFLIPWENPDPDLEFLLREDGYYDAFLYIGGVLEYQCVIYDFRRERTENGLTQRVWCYSPAADAVDSRVEGKRTYTEITLNALVTANIKDPLALNVEDLINDPTKFKQAQAGTTETIAQFLQKYCNQRQAFLNSKPDGNVRLWRANIDSPSIGTIEEGKAGPVGFLYEYKGRKRFTNYKGICETPSGTLEAFVTDLRVPLTRNTAIQIEAATTAEELEKSIKWHRNQTDAEAKKRVFPVTGLYGPDGNLYNENTIATIVSPTMNAPDGFNFLLEGIERKWNAQGITTDLHIVDPAAFSTGEVEGTQKAQGTTLVQAKPAPKVVFTPVGRGAVR